MRIDFLLVASLVAFSLNAERSPLTPEQLWEESDSSCMGVITDIQTKIECYNIACTNYRVDYTATMTTGSCYAEFDPVIYVRYFENFYNDGYPPPGPGGHYPKPEVGQNGTVFLKYGEIVYPNGWVPESANNN